MWAIIGALLLLVTSTQTQREEKTTTPIPSIFGRLRNPEAVSAVLEKHPWVKEDIRRNVRTQLVSLLEFMASGEKKLIPADVVRASQTVVAGITNSSISVNPVVPHVPSFFLMDPASQLVKMLQLLKDQEVSDLQKEALDSVADFLVQTKKDGTNASLLEPILSFLPNIFQGFGLFALVLLEEGFSFSG